MNHDSTFYLQYSQTQNINPVLVWLRTTPKTTCIRVNLLQTSSDEIKRLLLDALMKNHPAIIEYPRVSTVENFPEVILIENLRNTNDLVSIAAGKEVIVDVNCAASILRGT